MNFMVYDIGLLIIFVIFISIFLYRRKKNLKKEGLLLLYRTSWGMKLIDRVGEKWKKMLNFLSYGAIGLGYLLMGSVAACLVGGCPPLASPCVEAPRVVWTCRGVYMRLRSVFSRPSLLISLCILGTRPPFGGHTASRRTALPPQQAAP